MNKEQLETIKAVYLQINAGVSNPIKINEAYSFLNNEPQNVPIRTKIVAINRFYMLSYTDALTKLINEDKPPIEMPVFPESYGTTESLPKQSHSESFTHDEAHDDLGSFLTKAEKETLASPKTNTKLLHKTKRRK